MNYPMRLDLDLSALPLDDFEVAEDLSIETLTGVQAGKPCDTGCCNICACPCVCCERQ